MVDARARAARTPTRRSRASRSVRDVTTRDVEVAAEHDGLARLRQPVDERSRTQQLGVRHPLVVAKLVACRFADDGGLRPRAGRAAPGRSAAPRPSRAASTSPSPSSPRLRAPEARGLSTSVPVFGTSRPGASEDRVRLPRERRAQEPVVDRGRARGRPGGRAAAARDVGAARRRRRRASRSSRRAARAPRPGAPAGRARQDRRAGKPHHLRRGTPSVRAAACSRGRGSRSGPARRLLYCRCVSSSRTRPPSRRPTTTSSPPRSPRRRSTSSSSRLGSASATHRRRSATAAASSSIPFRRGCSDARGCASRSRRLEHLPGIGRAAASPAGRPASPVAGGAPARPASCCVRACRRSSPRTTSCRGGRPRSKSLWRDLLARFDRVVVHSERGRETSRRARRRRDASSPTPSSPAIRARARRRAHAPQSRHDPAVQGTRRRDRGDAADRRTRACSSPATRSNR